jgi:hypothetical protein
MKGAHFLAHTPARKGLTQENTTTGTESRDFHTGNTENRSLALLNAATANDPATAGQLLFSHRMVNTRGHLEHIEGNTGCLTVQGGDAEHRPLEFNDCLCA